MVLVQTVSVTLALSLQGCALFGGGGSSSGPAPGPSPGPTTAPPEEEREPGVKCSVAFAGCKSQLSADDDKGCYIDTTDKDGFDGCDKALQEHFAEYKSKQDDKAALNELIVGGATGTCLTALRLLYTEDKTCPMPLPPPTEKIQAPGDEFNVFSLGDWGPTPPGQFLNHAACSCPSVPGGECRDSMFYWWETSAPSLCSAERWQENNNAQQLVADAMAKLANDAKPVAVVNLGDNFYIGGIPTPHNIEVGDGFGVDKAYAFGTTWKDVYLKNSNGNGLNVPWLSVLGNHDYGGAGCQADWQLQIDFTKEDESWRMPWQYFKQRIQAKSYAVDIFMLEVNVADFLGGDEHAICTQNYCNAPAIWGDVELCKSRMRAKQDHMIKWLETELAKSVEDKVHWRILAGHFAIDPENVDVLTALGEKYGAALYIAGHTHANMFKEKGAPSAPHLPVLITGAGGGYRQEGDGDYYGFGKLAFSKDKIAISILDAHGEEKSTHEVSHPSTLFASARQEASSLRLQV